MPIISDGRTIVASGNTSSTAFSPKACRNTGPQGCGCGVMNQTCKPMQVLPALGPAF